MFLGYGSPFFNIINTNITRATNMMATIFIHELLKILIESPIKKKVIKNANIKSIVKYPCHVAGLQGNLPGLLAILNQYSF